jgi:predicted AAA+ superfamily ATPase
MGCEEEFGTYNQDTLDKNRFEVLSVLGDSSSEDRNILKQTEEQEGREEIRVVSVCLEKERVAQKRAPGTGDTKFC